MNLTLPSLGKSLLEKCWAPALAWVIFCLIYFSFCFQPGTLGSDDFAYLRSIVGTYQQARPYTYEWLEPFGVIFSSFSAILFWITKNFYLATFGIQAFWVLVFFVLFYLLLAKRLSTRFSALITLTIATLPLFLTKAGDFHGCFCTLDLFLAALLLYEAKQWKWFFLVAFAAFANRQNHICLMLLPIWNMVETYLQKGIVSKPIGLGVFLFGSMSIVLYLFMNHTYAAIHAVFINSDLISFFRSLAVAAIAGTLITLSILSIFLKWIGDSSKSEIGIRKTLSSNIYVSIVLLILIPFWHSSLIQFDTPLYGILSWSQLNLLLPWLILPTLWFLDFRILKLSPYLFLIMGYILIASIRGVWWDYYFMEIIIVGLLIVCPSSDNSVSVIDITSVRIWITLIILVGNIGYGYLLKVAGDKQKLGVFEMEHLEREGKIAVVNMTNGSFGLLGWKLFDYFWISNCITAFLANESLARFD